MTLYVVSLISCLVFWYGSYSNPDSEFSESIFKMGYKKSPMLLAAFIPLVNTLLATMLSIHTYVMMYEKMGDK